MGFVAAADFDGSKPLLCASMELQECIPGVGCERVTTDSINAAEFFRIPPQRIESSAKTDHLLVIQGSDNGVEGVRTDGLAYSIAIDKISGKMVLTASGDEGCFRIMHSNLTALHCPFGASE
jgi:hypothetical protein